MIYKLFIMLLNIKQRKYMVLYLHYPQFFRDIPLWLN